MLDSGRFWKLKLLLGALLPSIVDAVLTPFWSNTCSMMKWLSAPRMRGQAGCDPGDEPSLAGAHALLAFRYLASRRADGVAVHDLDDPDLPVVDAEAGVAAGLGAARTRRAPAPRALAGAGVAARTCSTRGCSPSHVTGPTTPSGASWLAD